MDKLPEHRILEFHPDTFEFIRRQYNLDKRGQMDEAIDLLEDWVRKQPHFTKKKFPREYLERTIILDKGSVERAKNQMDKLFTMRTSVPIFFEKADPRDKDIEMMHEHFVDALLPKLTKDHYRIYIGKVMKDGVTTKMLTSSFQFGAMILEHVRMFDYCSGFIGVFDYRDVNMMELVAQINVLEMHAFALFLTQGYQMRVKGIHLVTTSKAIELLVRILKQIFTKKIGDRIQVHTTLDSLYEHVPKELLPKELGGDQKSMVELNRDWVEELGKKENIELFKELREAKVNEKLRDGGPKPNDDLLGISGSFRTLCVD